MNNSISITPRRVLLIGLFGLLAVLSYGFAASNTVDSSNAGDGQSGISGYTVTNVHYVLDGTNPSNVSSLTFNLSPALPAGGATRISLNGGTSWLAAGDCTGTSTVTCTATVAVTALSNLRVVAAQ
jgi:hypothetical protein